MLVGDEVVDQHDECNRALWHHSIVWHVFGDKHQNLMRFTVYIGALYVLVDVSFCVRLVVRLKQRVMPMTRSGTQHPITGVNSLM